MMKKPCEIVHSGPDCDEGCCWEYYCKHGKSCTPEGIHLEDDGYDQDQLPSITVTHWEEMAPLPPGVHNPFTDVKVSIGVDGVSFTAQMDQTYEHSFAGLHRAFKAWAEYQIEVSHWRNLRMMREHHGTISFYPAWPVSREGVRESEGKENE